MNKFWIDPTQAALPKRPWRKIHLDFHNSQHIPRIGERFDAAEFGNTLAGANVDAIVVFAKDMHGYFYYPSAYGPVHRGLDFDLLGAQVEACRKRGIAVYAYYCTVWDNHLAETHPEWLLIKRDRTNYLPKFDEAPGWTALCLAHDDFIQLMLDHIAEFVARYDLDGPWLDMPTMKDSECFCPACLQQMREQGMDPFNTSDQRHHKQALHLRFIQRVADVVRAIRPGSQIDYNNVVNWFGIGERAPYQDNLDIEALPTSFWGYYYFPTVTRFARTFGKATYGMTGRFQNAWADFGGLKQPAQLHVELAGIVAHGAHVSIGDQPPPHARLDPAVYHVIGQAYARVKSFEPYLEGAVPVTEAALMVGGLPCDSPATPTNYGLVKLLTESRIQFDLVEPQANWERYRLIVLSEELHVDAALAERLRAYLASGGAVIVVNNAGDWLEQFGFRYEGPSPFKPAYMVAQHGDWPAYEFALYEGASRWRADDAGADVLAQLGEPLFQRSGAHYTSHAQTPFDHPTGHAAIARQGNLALFGFPLGLSYFNHGYWIYRELFQRVLRALLPDPLIQSDAPLSTELAMTHQAANDAHGERCLVHVINWSPARQSPRHPTFYEDPIPLTDVTVRVNLPSAATKARAVIAGVDLPIEHNDDGSVAVTLARVPISEIICFE
jgi:hypothetical protein